MSPRGSIVVLLNGALRDINYVLWVVFATFIALMLAAFVGFGHRDHLRRRTADDDDGDQCPAGHCPGGFLAIVANLLLPRHSAPMP